MKLCKYEMHSLPSYMAVISPIGQEGVLDLCHKRASPSPYSAGVLRTPAGDNLWYNPGATSALNCQISLEKDSALNQESVRMVTVSVALPLQQESFKSLTRLC